ncbi:MAG: hypothetical protein IJ562_08855 [Prevotella sp.]|nr:hypothetical protein [Prevotella sp.]
MEKKYVKPTLAELEVCGNKNIMQAGLEEGSTLSGGPGVNPNPTPTPGGDAKKSIWEYTAE